MNRCVFVRIAARSSQGEEQFRYRCRYCQIETGWTPSIAENVHCDCISTSNVSQDCAHRGAEPIGQHACEQCGERGKPVPVFACALHGRCVPRWWTVDGRQRRLSGETSCLTCPDRQEPALPPTS